MTRFHDALDGVAERAPRVHVPAGFYRRARRRHRLRWAAAALSVVAVVAAGALVTPWPPPGDPREHAAAGSAGRPDALVMPPWWAETVPGSPAGPASVVFGGDGVPQADHEDYDAAWWRPDYTVNPVVAVGLYSDVYRVVRGPYTVGTELSPDGRYLLTNESTVIDLVTGGSRVVGPRPGDRYVDAAWSVDGTRILSLEDTVTVVREWPSLTELGRFAHGEHHPVAQDLALSPDGSMLAVHSNQGLTVYRAGGTRVTTVPEEPRDLPELGRLRLAGRAAWQGDGRLAVFGRTDLTCADCGLHPGTWRLRFLAPTADPVLLPEASYPVLRSALDVNVVAWRGETAYAVVTFARDGTADPGRVELVRLRPGAGAYDRLLTAPAGATSMQVATAFVDVRRPTGGPEFGVNRLEVVGEVVNGFLCFSPFLLLIVVLVLIRRRARRPVRSRPAPGPAPPRTRRPGRSGA